MRVYLNLILLFTFSSLFSQTGSYFITNYSPIDYNGSNQVWGIVQDNRGVMYFAADQILEYDGVRWRKIPVSNNSTIRSLAIDTNTNIIYVGGVNQFGYLSPDSTGQLNYTSISDDLDSDKQNFDDVWRTEVGADGVYFSTNNSLFRYSLKDELAGKSPLTIWSQSFFLLYKIKNRIFTGVRGKGIVEVVGDSLIPLKHNSDKDNLFTWFIFPYHKDKYLLGNSASGITIYDPKSQADHYLFKTPYFDQAEVEKTDEFIFQNQLYSGADLGNNTYALGTINKGIIIINDKGKIIHRINKENGLQNGTIHYLYKDRQGGLWVAMTYGISRIEINTPITHFDDLSDIQGSIYNTIHNNGDIYVSSNLGLFKKEKNHFIPVEGLTGPKAIQCFGLTNINVPYDTVPHLFASATNGIYEVIDNKAKLIFNNESYDIVQSENGTILMAYGSRIFLVKYINNKWTVSEKIKFKNDVSNLFMENDTTLWFLSENIPNKLNFNKDFTSHSKPIILTLKNDSVEFSNIIKIQNKIMFVSNNGLYQHKGNQLKKDSLIFGGLLNNEKNIYQIEEVNQNQVWLNIKRGLKYQIKIISKTNNSFKIDSLLFNRLPNYEDFVADGDSVMWILSAKALFRVDIKNFKIQSLKENTLIRLVTVNSDSVIFKGAFYKEKGELNYISLEQKNHISPILSYDNNNLTFEFALASFNNEKKNEFSYCLKKDNEVETWSNWSLDAKKEYTNLSEGIYQFMVKARDIYHNESQVSVYSFSITPPWYRRNWAYLLYFVISIIIVWLILKIYTNKLKKQKNFLENLIRKRTKEIWEQKEEISKQAENLQKSNAALILSNQEINQKNAEIEAQRDNLQNLTDDLKQRAEEIKSQNEALEKQKDVLEIINQDVNDSIKYALRLQNAALPDPESLKKYVDDAFIFFKPKDIVSGDFYWFAKVINNTVITAIDCTGHGVPGALMSILGLSLINEIVVREYITHPGVILQKLRKSVIRALNQGANSIEKDGMDMSLISINHKEKTIQYAGAFNPLYIIRPIENISQKYEFMIENNRNEHFVLYEIKADKMPISIFTRMDRFTTHEFEYKKGDMFYLFSDGFPDQFGGPKGKKFKYKPLKKLLIDNASKSMSEQREVIENTCKLWKGVLEQIDDIVIIGAKL